MGAGKECISPVSPFFWVRFFWASESLSELKRSEPITPAGMIRLRRGPPGLRFFRGPHIPSVAQIAKAFMTPGGVLANETDPTQSDLWVGGGKRDSTCCGLWVMGNLITPTQRERER